MAETKSTIRKIGPSFVIDDGKILLEQVKEDDKIQFAIYREKTDEVEYKSTFEHENSKTGQKTIYHPKKGKVVGSEAVRFPERAEDYGSESELLDEITELINAWLDVPKQFLELASWYVLLTYVFDKMSTVPYLRFLGTHGTGKTRGMKIVGGLCYRPVTAGGSTTAAAMERLAEYWHGTLLLNEADFRFSDAKQDIVKILNEGFEKKGTVIKAHKKKQDEVVVTKPYCPKILTTRNRWKDEALESRCLTQIMRATEREDILPVITDDFWNDAQVLRNKLLMYRFRNYSKVDVNAVKEIWNGIKGSGLERRLVQATCSFAVLFYKDKEMFKRFNQFLKDYQDELKETRATTLDGKMCQAINDLKKEGVKVTPGRIAERLEMDYSEEDVSPTTVGMHLKTIGLHTKVGRVGEKTARILKDDNKTVRKILARFVPPDTEVFGRRGLDRFGDETVFCEDCLEDGIENLAHRRIYRNGKEAALCKSCLRASGYEGGD